MCRVVSQELAPDVSSVSQARKAVRVALDRWELSPLTPDAELLVSELVTNAIVHARSDTALTMAVADGTLEVGVTDRAPGVPLHRAESGAPAQPPKDSHAEGGRGLRLLELVADEWGVVDLPEGKQVWFRLDVGEGWPHRTCCPCGGEDLERVRLESGRYAVATPGPWDPKD